MNTKQQPRHPLINEFVSEYTKQRNWTIGAQRNVTYCLTALMKSIKKEPKDITEQDVIDYCVIRKEREFWTHCNTLLNSLWIIRMFSRFLVSKGMLSEPYKLKIKLHKELPHNIDRHIYSAVRKQKRVVDRFSINVRDKAIWYLMYFSTALIEDIPRIKKQNVFLDKGYIYLDEVKSGRVHYIILQSEAIQILKLYVARYKIDSEYFFHTHRDKNKPMSSQYARVILRHIYSKANVRITSRELLDLKISIAIQANVDLRTLQCMFGITSLKKFQERLDNKGTKLKIFKEWRKVNKTVKKHNLV